ncbi:ATP-binding protein [Fischerella sp.]|uniref:sensor histidine kinase n=1 Tax=Fischerella sp. TaxID=1191 RepID=UPI0025C37E09|nr:ATP-binding protein [Fischerella sp.]
MRSAINTAVEIMQPLADERGLQLVLNIEDAPPQVLTDPLRLQQILLNLISNAIRYTEKGSVTIECCTRADNQWSISVIDTGIGISEEDQARLFQPFVRAKSTKNQHPADSTGLGLAIVERLVELLQGKIDLVSQIGQGSIFTVILPLKMSYSEEAEDKIEKATSE